MVLQLTAEIGLDGLDSGPLAHAAQIEAMCVLWVSLVRGGYIDRRTGFKLLRG
jgi:predicted dinucleotide-binding enzyme